MQPFANEPYWADIPKELIQQFVWGSSFAEISSSYILVCKAWQLAMEGNYAGSRLLEQAGIVASEPQTWRGLFREFIQTRHIIALDVSGSMFSERENLDYTCFDLAKKVIQRQLCRLEEPMAHRFVTGILFAGKTSQEDLRSADKGFSFFTAEEKRCRVGVGTNINYLFKQIVTLGNECRSKDPNAQIEVTVISDFDDATITLGEIANMNMSVQLVSVSQEAHKDYSSKVLKDYSSWVAKEAESYATKMLKEIEEREKREMAEALYRSRIELQKPRQRQLIGRSAKKQQHSLRHYSVRNAAPRNSPLKRTHDELVAEHTAPLDLSVAMSDTWAPLLKKRRISNPSQLVQ